jgi:CheY-like chemotaxis protein
MFAMPYTIDSTVFNHTAKSRKNRAKLQILVVEDDEFSRSLLKRVIKDYELVEAANGKDALEAYSLNAPDILFLDIELPDIKGDMIVTEVMKADKDAFIVMLTSHTEAALVKKLVEAGVKGYIAKPFSPDRVLHYIDQFRKLGK